MEPGEGGQTDTIRSTYLGDKIGDKGPRFYLRTLKIVQWKGKLSPGPAGTVMTLNA